ncbi:MAG: hypothetical protein V1934_03245 [Methanobacteriota archaeon]
MTIVWLMEYDIPKDEAAEARYSKYIFEDEYSCKVMDKCKEIGAKLNVWSDGLHHIVMTIEFKHMDDYARLFDDKDWKKGLWQLDQLVLNVKTRIMWPAGE